MMNTKNECVYSMDELVAQIENPYLTTKPKLFTFLRRFNILEGMMPKPELIARGLFTIQFYNQKCGSFQKTVQVVRVSKNGIKFVNELLN